MCTHFSGLLFMPQQRCLKAIANACTHRGCRAELQLRSLAAYHPMRCWQHLSDGATAWSRTNDSDVRAHMSRALGRLALACADVQAGSDLKCTHAPWLPGRAAASLARGCVTRCSAGSIWAMVLLLGAAQMIAMSARTCRAHFDGLPLRANVQAGSDRKCMRLPARAAALLARGCVAAGAIVRMWDCWSRANGAVFCVRMPRAF